MRAFSTVSGDRQMALKLPYHACYQLEAEARLRLSDAESVGEVNALVRNLP
jgi:hypothetical protein